MPGNLKSILSQFWAISRTHQHGRTSCPYHSNWEKGGLPKKPQQSPYLPPKLTREGKSFFILKVEPCLTQNLNSMFRERVQLKHGHFGQNSEDPKACRTEKRGGGECHVSRRMKWQQDGCLHEGIAQGWLGGGPAGYVTSCNCSIADCSHLGQSWICQVQSHHSYLVCKPGLIHSYCGHRWRDLGAKANVFTWGQSPKTSSCLPWVFLSPFLLPPSRPRTHRAICAEIGPWRLPAMSRPLERPKGRGTSRLTGRGSAFPVAHLWSPSGAYVR